MSEHSAPTASEPNAQMLQSGKVSVDISISSRAELLVAVIVGYVRLHSALSPDRRSGADLFLRGQSFAEHSAPTASEPNAQMLQSGKVSVDISISSRAELRESNDIDLMRALAASRLRSTARRTSRPPRTLGDSSKTERAERPDAAKRQGKRRYFDQLAGRAAGQKRERTCSRGSR
jgi:hypothetical protein